MNPRLVLRIGLLLIAGVVGLWAGRLGNPLLSFGVVVERQLKSK